MIALGKVRGDEATKSIKYSVLNFSKVNAVVRMH